MEITDEYGGKRLDFTPEDDSKFATAVEETCVEECVEKVAEDDESSAKNGTRYIQWSSDDGVTYFPCCKTHKKLKPGFYEVIKRQGCLGLQRFPVKTDELIRFPDSVIDSVIEEIKTFWDRAESFERYGLIHKRGILLYGSPGCHAKGTKVLMFDGRVEKVEDVGVGDLLMGPDSKPRRVLELRRGREKMYRVTPVKGEPFVVNENHILHLSRSKKRSRALPPKLDITVRDYLNLSKPSQEKYKLLRTGVEFQQQIGKLPVDPYFLGVWLGDGSERDLIVSSADPEIAACVRKVAATRGLEVSEKRKTSSVCRDYRIVHSSHKKGRNPILTAMKDLGVMGNKHIPFKYLRASREDRLALLAGIIDTDGSYSQVSWRGSSKYKKTGHKGYFEIIQKRKALAEQVLWLARSLGFGATCKAVKKRCVNGKDKRPKTYYRISVYGDIAQIPVKVKRKKAQRGRANKDPMHTGIRKIEPVGRGRYYGFTISDDHLYLTNDFVVHHNCGKSCLIQLICEDVIARGGIVLKFESPTWTSRMLKAIREIQPDTPIVVLMEDIDSIIREYCESEVLNILDGVDRVNKAVFIATTNYPERLGKRIINRPSRFDKRFEIGYPSKSARRVFFKHLFAKEPEESWELDKWVDATDKMSFAHLKELFVANIILGDKFDDALDTLREMMQKELDSEKMDYDDRPMGFGRGIKALKSRHRHEWPCDDDCEEDDDE